MDKVDWIFLSVIVGLLALLIVGCWFVDGKRIETYARITGIHITRAELLCCGADMFKIDGKPLKECYTNELRDK
jgi:hypothetical protein